MAEFVSTDPLVSTGPMVREIIVVEGKHDISAVRRAVAAELISTNGFALGPDAVLRIRRAVASGRGVIVFTDPDTAGEQIRRRVAEIAGPCKHAFLPRDACTLDGDIGIENASPSAICQALTLARATSSAVRSEFTVRDLVRCGLDGISGAHTRRIRIGALLGLGYGNARQLLRRLNHYDVTRDEFEAAAASLEVLTSP